MSEPYLSDYEYHLRQLRAHLAGDTDQPLPSSFIPPAGYWTSREKDLFFHALVVHSRFRPDLIAASVKSKTIIDVCAYIDALDQAAVAAPPFQMPSLRSSLNGAMEVSESWVQHEEEQASILIEMEPEWEREGEEHRRSKLLESRSDNEPTYSIWKEEQQGLWDKQDSLAKLSIHHLQALDKLNRNADTRCHEIEPPSADIPTPAFDDSLIDPALLALSSSPARLPANALASAEQDRPLTPEFSPNPFSPPLPSSPNPNPHVFDLDPGQLSPASRRRLAKRLHMRKQRAEAAGKEADMASVKLLPGRKKTTEDSRLHKSRPKKYKPRKAGKWIQEADLQGKATKHKPSKLKPVKWIHFDLQDEANGSHVAAGPSVTNAEDEDDTNGLSVPDPDVNNAPTVRHGKRGLTSAHKILSLFEERGINANTLIECGLDIFNLSALGKLMGLIHSAYADSDEKIDSSISIETVKLLRNILLDFVSTLIHRAISIREQEVLLKRKIKVWRLDKEDEVAPANVADALQMQALSTHSLLSEVTEDGEGDVPHDATPGVPQVEGEDRQSDDIVEQSLVVEDDSSFHARLPPHREIAPLFVTMPRRVDDEQLMSTTTDEEELLAELDDEWELDKLDRRLEARYETTLWQAMNGGKP
ncbi:hypothetical protein GGX14DRAFT_439411 [Mycena pura]|uniref:Uncharacterized protein n=1 Tax=Mycena pura TaxID=153505 RepID=A0AAD6VPL2_9AGAR|nr:hypothetical protein GGX14DRAFT_439411 [Mycena pura]